MPTTRTLRATRPAGIAVLASLVTLSSLVLGATPAAAVSATEPVTGLVSVGLDGRAANGSTAVAVPSAGGRFIAFASPASNLVAGDTNGKVDVFVRDTLAATTTRVSTSGTGGQGDGDSDEPSISPDGRFLAFTSEAANLVAGDTNGQSDVFWRDLWTGTTKRVSLAHDSITQATGGGSVHPSVSADGTLVTFQSWATNLVAGDTNAASDVFVRSVGGATTERVTVTGSEAQLTAPSIDPAASADGRYVAFESKTTQIGTDTNGTSDVFLRDRTLGTTERVSVGDDEAQGNSYSSVPDVSDDGRYVVFQSHASNLVPEATATEIDVFRRDRATGHTLLLSRSSAGTPGDHGGSWPTISGDGSKVAFGSTSTNLVAGDTNGEPDAFVRTLVNGTTARMSTTTAGAQLADQTYGPGFSTDGSTVTFANPGAGVTGAADTNGTFDVFWRGTHQVGPNGDGAGVIAQSAKDVGSPLSPGALAPLVSRVRSGTASPSSVVDDLLHGTFDASRGPVMRLYWSFFHRVPDQGGLDHWVGKHATGTRLATIAARFASSSEFKATYGALGDSAFVGLVYQHVLGRAPDAAGLAHWVAVLQGGATRGDVMTAFSEASEGKRLMRAEVDTFLVSLAMVRRLPTAAELGDAVALLDAQGGQPTEVLILAVLTSPAYAARFPL